MRVIPGLLRSHVFAAVVLPHVSPTICTTNSCDGDDNDMMCDEERNEA